MKKQVSTNKQVNTGSVSNNISSAPKTSPNFPNWIYIVIIAFCFALYGNTICNKFVLDDSVVLTQNKYVKDGVKGIPELFKYDTFAGSFNTEETVLLPGGRYRPLSVALLSVEYNLFVNKEVKQIIDDKRNPEKKQYIIPREFKSLKKLTEIADSTETAYIMNKVGGIQYDDEGVLLENTVLPYASHTVNILLFALTACFLFMFLVRIFPVGDARGWKLLFNVPVIATLLFIAHPIHVEAIANIKGRDEIMTFLGSLMALYYTIRWMDTRKWKYLVITFLTFLAGAFSKENALTVLILIPLTIYFFVGEYKLKHVLLFILSIAAPIFLILKGYTVVGTTTAQAVPLLSVGLILSVIPFLILAFSNKNQSLKELAMAVLPSFLAALVFVVARYQVILSPLIANINSTGIAPAEVTELMNNPFLGMNGIEKWASVIYVLGRYLWVLIFPHPLTYDYYPYHIPKVTMSGVASSEFVNTIGAGNIVIIISLIVYAALGAFILWGMQSNRKNKYAYAALWYLIPLSIVANIFVSIGTFMNERFLFISSVGFCLAIAYLLAGNLPGWIKNVKAYRGIVIGLLVVVLGLYSVKTISRNKAWKDNFTLFVTDYKTSSNSAFSNYYLSSTYFNTKYLADKDSMRVDYDIRQVYTYSKRAVEINPNYVNALVYYAWSNNILGDRTDSVTKYPLENSINALVNAVHVSPYGPHPTLSMMKDFLIRIPNPEQRIKAWDQYINANPADYQPYHIAGRIYAIELHDPAKSLPYFEKTVELNPQFIDGLIDLGFTYSLLGNKIKALEMQEKAYLLDPHNVYTLENLFNLYHELGNTEKAQYFYQLYQTAKQSRVK